MTPASILSRAVSLTKLKIRKEKEISGTCRFSLEKVNRVCKAEQGNALYNNISGQQGSRGKQGRSKSLEGLRKEIPMANTVTSGL